jgi:hypothetical protein
MNIQALTDLADYLDSGELSAPFNMCCYSHCAAGHYIRREMLRNKECFGDTEVTQRAQDSIPNIFDMESGGLDWAFCFGPEWGNLGQHAIINDVHAAAHRLRYVARHGSAPSMDQWKRFETVPTTSLREVAEDSEPVEALV